VGIDFPFDRDSFAIDGSAQVRDYLPSDREQLVALEKRVLGEEYFRVRTSRRSRCEPPFSGRVRARLLGLKRRELVLVAEDRAVGFVLVRADASANVGGIEELLIEEDHVDYLPALLKADLEFFEGLGKRRALLTFPAEQEAISDRVEHLGFREELTILNMVCWFCWRK
jgi:hypothetical protein